MSLIVQKNQCQRWLGSDPPSASKKAAFANIHKEVQSAMHKMKDEWLSKKTDEIQSYADQHNSKCFYEALKCVYGPQSSGSSPLLSADGTKLITNWNKILERLAKHFSAVLNHPSSINDEAIQHLPLVPVNHELDVPPTLGETQKTIWKLSNGKMHPGLMLYQPKSTNMVDLYCTRSWLTSSSPYDSKVLYHMTSRMHLSFISTREKEITNSVTITMAYHSCP